MRRVLAVGAAAFLGLVVGAVVMLSLPAPGVRSPQEESRPSPAPARQKVEITTLLAWTPNELPPGLATAAISLSEVEAVAEVRSGIGWLSSWASGEKTHSLPAAGFNIPVEIAAIDPGDYQRFVPPADRSRFAELDRGGSLLGRTGAGLRRIETTGSLQFGEHSMFVHGVVDDELIGGHEVAVSFETAATIRIDRPRYMLLALRPGSSREHVEERLRALLPEGVRMRVRGPGETPVFRHGDAVLPPIHLKNFFGEFSARVGPGNVLQVDPQWMDDNLTTTSVPILGTVHCHRAIVPQLQAALAEVNRRGLERLVRSGDFGGCFSPRFLSSDPAAGLSHHSWGVAFDVNVSENPFGAEPRIDSRLVEIFERWGFTWGGRWLVPDGMHFEFQRWPLTPKG